MVVHRRQVAQHEEEGAAGVRLGGAAREEDEVGRKAGPCRGHQHFAAGEAVASELGQAVGEVGGGRGRAGQQPAAGRAGVEELEAENVLHRHLALGDVQVRPGLLPVLVEPGPQEVLRAAHEAARHADQRQVRGREADSQAEALLFHTGQVT